MIANKPPPVTLPRRPRATSSVTYPRRFHLRPRRFPVCTRPDRQKIFSISIIFFIFLLIIPFQSAIISIRKRNICWCGSMAEQLIRNEQVVSSILTTSSTPQSLTYQGVAAFLCLEKIGPKTADFCVCCHFVATCCHPKCRVARMSRLAVFEIGINSARKRQKYSCQIGNRFGRSCQNGDGMQRQRIV